MQFTYRYELALERVNYILNSSCPRNMEQFGNPFEWWKKMRAQF